MRYFYQGNGDSFIGIIYEKGRSEAINSIRFCDVF